MNLIVRIWRVLQVDMPEPAPYGWYHLIWILLGVAAIGFLYSQRRHFGEKQLKWVLGIYGGVAAVTELLKQLSWSLVESEATGQLVWDYSWYSAPFQLCSTPIYVSLICLFLKKGKLRDHLLSYLALVTILGGLMTMLIPSSCFVEDILVNIHTMWLHCGSLVVGIYLLMSKAVPLTAQSLRHAAVTFLCLAGIALTMNVAVYHSGVLNGETFNMFYISPYFISELPVFNTIQRSVPYPVFLASYVVGLMLGSALILLIALMIRRFVKYVNNGWKTPVHN